jgi:hypothetical protein
MSAERLEDWFKDPPDQTQAPPALTRDDVLSFLPDDIDAETQEILFQALGIDQPAAVPAKDAGDFYEKNFGVPAPNAPASATSVPAGPGLTIAKAAPAENIIRYEFPAAPAVTASPADSRLEALLQRVKASQQKLDLEWTPWIQWAIDDGLSQCRAEKLADALDEVCLMQDAGYALDRHDCSALAESFYAGKDYLLSRAGKKLKKKWLKQRAKADGTESATPAWLCRAGSLLKRAGGPVKRAGVAAFRYVNKKADEGVASVGSSIGYRAAAVAHSPRARTFLKYALPVAIAAGLGFMGYVRHKNMKPKAPVVVNLDEKLTSVFYRNKEWLVPETAVEQVRKYVVQSRSRGIPPADIEQRLKDASAVDGVPESKPDNRIYTPGLAKLK